MQEPLRVCVARSSALAAISALAAWHELGHFISLIERVEGPRALANGRSEVYVRARLNTGTWISCFCLIIPRTPHDPAEFPIEHVLVSFDEGCGRNGHLHHLCDLSASGIIFPQSWEERPVY